MLKFLFKRLPPNRFPHFSSRSPYNENEFEAPQLEYLKNLHSFSYADLLLEIKKYPGKPETRTKYKILKFISSALPKKDGIPIIPKKTYKSEKEENNPSDSIPENPPLIEPNIEQLKNKINVEEEKAKINQELSNEYYIRDEDYDMEIPLSNQSLYENELLEGPLRDFISNLYSHAKNPQETTPFFENYSPNQILAESCKLSEANLRSELKALHTRSNLFQAPLTDSRMRMVRRSEIKRIFYEMVNLEGEFQKKTTDHLTTLMIEIKQNNVSRQTVQKFIRNLSNPLHCLNDISFFKGAPSNVLSLTWETITSFVHCRYFLKKSLFILF